MNQRKFARMNDASPLVKLAAHLGYKVFKEVVDFDTTRHASYRIKNSRGEAFGSDALSVALANAIKHDFKFYARKAQEEGTEGKEKES